MIDALAFESQFLDHLAPVWLALPEAIRGTFRAEPSLVARAQAKGIDAIAQPRPPHVPAYPAARHDGPPVLVASYGDIKEGRRLGYGPFAFLEHGAGQSYGSPTNGSYAGGPDRADNELILVPNTYCADIWTRAYPQARVQVVGCPKLDSLPQREGGDSATVVALSFHWPTPISISGYAGTAIGDFLPALPAVVQRFATIGHAHPKADWPAQMQRQYRRLGVPFVGDFDDVCRQADIYVCDNSSTIFEFAATGRPVVVLNAKSWSRRYSVGLRFWEAADVGVNVWPTDDLVTAIERALEERPDDVAAREAALELVYQPRSGGAQMAAAAIADWLDTKASAAA